MWQNAGKTAGKYEKDGGEVGEGRRESRKGTAGSGRRPAGNELTTGVVRTYHLSGKNLRLKW